MTGSPLSALAGLALLGVSGPPLSADSAAVSALAPRVVSGASGPIDPDRWPLPCSVLAGDSLQREHTLPIARAIESLPGVHTLSTGEAIGKPVLRGLAGPRVLVLEDGYRLEDYSWSDEDGPSLDLRLVDRAEVIRGPASVLYGSDALGGVVNAVPAALPDGRGQAPFARAGLEAYAASNNDEFGGAVRLEGASQAWGGRLFVVGRTASDLHTPEGTIPNTEFHAGNGEAALGFRGEGGGATLRYARQAGEFELLGADTPSLGQGSQETSPRHKLDDNRIQFDGSIPLGGFRFECRAQWQDHSLIEIAGAAAGAGAESETFHLVLDTYALDLLAHHGAGALRGTLGVSGLAQTNDTRGPIPVVPDAKTYAGAAFALEELDRGRWSFQAGGRVDRRHLDTERNAVLGLPDQSRADIEVSASGGLLFRATEILTLSANAGRGFRSPSLFELYANGPHLGEPRYELGDPELTPERSFEADLGARARWQRVRLELDGFVNRIDHFIHVLPIGETRVVGADTLAVYEYTQGDARLAGGELAAEIDAARPLTLRARADYARGQNLSLDQPLSQVPPLTLALEIELRGANLGWAEQGSASIEVEHASEQNRLGPFDVATDSYTLLHLDAGISRRFGGRTLRADLRVHNLLDQTYRSFLSRYRTFAPDPGRNVVLRLSTGI